MRARGLAAQRALLEAGWRCERCGHPGALELPVWRWRAWLRGHDGDAAAALDALADWCGVSALEGLRIVHEIEARVLVPCVGLPCDSWCDHGGGQVRGHVMATLLDGRRENAAWWNLAPLCSACDLVARHGRSDLHVVPPLELVTLEPWALPRVAARLASSTVGLELDRAAARDRAGEFLAGMYPGLPLESVH